MRPGQAEPNELERAILERIAERHASIRPFLRSLHVLSREFTGVGSFTSFLCEEAGPAATDTRLGLDALIAMPGVRSGMGAVLLCRDGRPACLETYTFGDERWDGVFEGFSITAPT